MASSADGGVCTLFVKRLPDRCTADELARAFAAAQVTTTAIKLLKRRRAIVDLAQLTPEAEALLSAGSLVVVGDGVGEQERCCCPVILPDRGGVLPGGASEPDMRALRTLTCPLCAREFPSQRRLRAHLADASAHRSHRPPQWSHERLAELDLSPNAMVSQMGVPQRHTLDAYLGYAAPRWAELPSIVDHIASHHPQSLRVKELLETMECFRLVGQFLYDQQHASSGGGGGAPGGGDDDGAEGGGAIREILDLACGHGLLGVLLAYRFPELPVTCVDLEPRACFEHYRAAWEAEGSAAAGHGLPLDNLSFVRQDVAEVPIAPHTAVVCVHACNEANLIVLRRCRDVGATFAVMPCCLPEGIYGTDCRRLPDQLRYPAMVGMLAAQFRALRIRAIDSRITNRNMVCMGPARGTEDEEVVLQRTCRFEHAASADG